MLTRTPRVLDSASRDRVIDVRGPVTNHPGAQLNTSAITNFHKSPPTPIESSRLLQRSRTGAVLRPLRVGIALLLADNTGHQLGDRHGDRSRERAVVRNRQHA